MLGAQACNGSVVGRITADVDQLNLEISPAHLPEPRRSFRGSSLRIRRVTDADRKAIVADLVETGRRHKGIPDPVSRQSNVTVLYLLRDARIWRRYCN
jgi:hypothetical protein